MTALLDLSPLLVVYVLMVILLILTMNVLNNYCMPLMILRGGIKITALEESANFATLDTEKLFSKLKSHELSRKGRPNHDASLTSKTFITSARVGRHYANLGNTIASSALEFALSSLATASDEQHKSIPGDEIALLASKFRALHKFRKKRRRSPRCCFVFGDTIYR
jgi:hypothetical protein